MPLPHLWAILFFIMMYVLGLGSQIAGIEAITTAVIDQWPHLRSTHWKVSYIFSINLMQFILKLLL
jgi:solute carrier family 6 (neurotransmitter transporter, glycine) member 5/9